MNERARVLVQPHRPLIGGGRGGAGPFLNLKKSRSPQWEVPIRAAVDRDRSPEFVHWAW